MRLKWKPIADLSIAVMGGNPGILEKIEEVLGVLFGSAIKQVGTKSYYDLDINLIKLHCFSDAAAAWKGQFTKVQEGLKAHLHNVSGSLQSVAAACEREALFASFERSGGNNH